MRKRAALLVLLSILAFGAFGTTSGNLAQFYSAFSSLSDSMGTALAMNSTIGSTWSDAFIGSFPNFGVGISVGAAFTGPDSTKKAFDALGQSVPNGLDQLGLPVPAIAGTLKIGFPYLPLDLGLKLGFIPQSLGDQLNLSGVNAQYTIIGLEGRWGLVKERFFVPKISVGLGVAYQKGQISTPISGTGDVTYTSKDGLKNYDVLFNNSSAVFSWENTSVDLTLQVSKRILYILTPYVGTGLTVGRSNITGGVNGINVTGAGDASSLQNQLRADGYNFDVSNGGFSLSSSNTNAVFRFYGGFSLNILLALDLQLMYVPQTQNLGVSLNARIQL